jgi:hypothetical protein
LEAEFCFVESVEFFGVPYGLGAKLLSIGVTQHLLLAAPR